MWGNDGTWSFSMELPGLHACFVPRLLSPRPSLLNAASDARLNSSPQKPLDLKQLKQRAAAIPPIVSTPPPRDGTGSLAAACAIRVLG